MGNEFTPHYTWQTTADVAAQYAPIVKAAGMWTPKYDDKQVFMLATAIMNDEEVFKRAGAFKVEVGCVVPAGSTVRALQAMSERELDALVERITTKYSNTSIKKG